MDTSLGLIEIEGFNDGTVIGRFIGKVVGSIEGTIVGLRVCKTEEGVTVDEEGRLYFLLLLSLIVLRINGEM